MASKEITMYLAPWQKRIMVDFLSKDQLKKFAITKVTRIVIKNPKDLCLMSYKIMASGMRRDDWLLYLTDEQMNIVKQELGLRVAISSINITGPDLARGAIRFV